MTIHGSCLCGSVRFEVEKAAGPFEICHCNRCRKVSGSAGLPVISVLSADYLMTAGRELVAAYTAPILYRPPAYRSWFCSKCGSPVPPPDPQGEKLEIPAGLLDDDPEIRPDKHIFIEFVPSWDRITDGLPQYTIKQLALERSGEELPEDFTLRSHYEAQ
jgi:hypothetical protein